MQMTPQDANQLAREGAADLQAGRAADAREKLERIAAAGFQNPELWNLVAMACRALGDAQGEEAALDRLLALDPRALRAIIQKADCRAKAGDDSAAAMLYRKALSLAEGQNVPPALVTELRRAEATMAQLKARFTAHLDAALAGLGFPEGGRSPRFQQSLDLRAGRKQVYFQEPTLYYFPELPQVQYFEREDFPWVGAVEAATDVIRDELRAMLATGRDGFLPYIRSEANQPRDHPLLDRLDWSALFFVENGERNEAVIAACPRTWEVMQQLPLPVIDKAGPSIMFSLLTPGTRIPAHSGTHNTRLICHLPLIVPPGCGFRVGNETREWEVGKVLIFDDTIEHEAWNDSAEERVVLIFDVWRPELSDQERREVTALFAASQSPLAGPQAG
jgi:aspartyl/asparaginyl beta-hydroxylase (cupin superfamily)